LQNLGMGLVGAFVGGLLFRLLGLFPGLDAATISLRDIVAAVAGTSLVLAVLWIGHWSLAGAAAPASKTAEASHGRNRTCHELGRFRRSHVAGGRAHRTVDVS